MKTGTVQFDGCRVGQVVDQLQKLRQNVRDEPDVIIDSRSKQAHSLVESGSASTPERRVEVTVHADQQIILSDPSRLRYLRLRDKRFELSRRHVADAHERNFPIWREEV